MRRWATALLAAMGLVLIAGTDAALADGTGASAGGLGTFHTSAARNSFVFGAETPTNGSGGQGFITVFDVQHRVYYAAQVSCLYVDPSTGYATIWGQLTSNNDGPYWKSVVLYLKPGRNSAAGFGNYLETYAAPSTCGTFSAPGTPAIDLGVISTHQ